MKLKVVETLVSILVMVYQSCILYFNNGRVVFPWKMIVCSFVSLAFVITFYIHVPKPLAIQNGKNVKLPTTKHLLHSLKHDSKQWGTELKV